MRVEGKEGTMRWLVSGTWDALCVSTSGGASFQVCDRKYVHGGNNIQVCGKIVSVSFEYSNQRSGEDQEVSERTNFQSTFLNHLGLGFVLFARTLLANTSLTGKTKQNKASSMSH